MRRAGGDSWVGVVQAVTGTSVTFLTDGGLQWCGDRWEEGVSWELLGSWLGIVVSPGTWAVAEGGGVVRGWVWSAHERWTCLTGAGMLPEGLVLRRARLVPVVTPAVLESGSVHTIKVDDGEVEAVWWSVGWWVPSEGRRALVEQAPVVRSWALAPA